MTKTARGRRFAPALVCVGLASILIAGAAWAGTMTPTSKALGAGRTTVTACGNLASATITYRVTANAVTGLTATGLPASCNGSSLRATLASAAGTDLGHAGPVTVAASAATFGSFTATPTASSVASVRLAATGP
jgi:hypothetical protein